MSSLEVRWTRFVRLGLALAAAAVLLHAQGGPPGAVVNDMLVVPVGVGRAIYAATDAGVFRSQDGGATWTPFSEGLPTDEFAVQSISGVENQLFVAVDGAGVWRWTGTGSWEQKSDGIGDLQTLAVAVKPGDPQTLLTGTRSQGVFFSNNGGDGWIRPGTLTVVGSFPEIAYSPADPQRILIAANPGVVIESRDGGQSWNARAGDPRVSFRGIAFDPNDSNVAYVASNLGLFRQSAPGQNLALLSTTVNFPLADVVVDPADSNILYAAHQRFGIITSKDKGATWTSGSGLPFAGGFSVLALAGDTTRVLAGAWGTGVFLSDDQGATFRPSSIGMNGANVLSIAVDPRNAGVAYASTSGGGIFKTVNSGDSWTESRSGNAQFSPGLLRIDPADSNRIYSGSVNPFDTFDGSLQRSDDAGATWNAVLRGAPALALALHPTDGQTLWFGTSSGFYAERISLYRSRDRGANFSGFLDTFNIRGLGIDPNNARNLYVISEYSGIYELLRTTNEGQDFLRGAQTTSRMFTVVVDPADSRRVFLGMDGGVFLSTDSGQNFSLKSAGLPTSDGIAVISLTIDPRDGAIYIATTSGVFKSTNGADTWFQLTNGLGAAAVRQIAVDPHTPGGLYAATNGSGVLRSTDGGSSWGATGTSSAMISRESIVGAFDFVGGGVAPGELVSIFGQGIGPSQGVAVSAFDPSTGKLPTTVGGVRVFFNDIPAPLLFVRSDQVNVQVPFEVAGSQHVNVRVEFDGISSNTVSITVVDAHPGLFPTAVNLDGSLNGENARSRPSAFVSLYATGQGATTPAVETGATAPATEPLARSVAEVRVLVAGREALVTFAGLAPNFVGLLQVNVQLPGDLPPGRHEVELRIGGRTAGALGSVWIAGP